MAAKVLTDEDIAKLDAAPELTDEQISALDSPKPERDSRISTLNPIGINPASGFIGTDPRDFAKGVQDTGFGIVEGFTGGLLKPNKFEGVEQDSNLAGKIAGFAAGPGKLIRGATAPLQGVKYAGPAIRGAVEGAFGGLAFPADDLDQRISNAKTGAILGAPLEAGASALGQAWGAFQKFRAAKQELKTLSNMKNSLKQKKFELGEEKFNVIDPDLADTQGIQQRMKRLNQAEKEIIATQKSAMDEQMKGLSKQLDSEAQTQAQAIKEPTLNYMRKFKDEWGQQFDELLESADTAEQGIKISELKQIEQEVIDELAELGIDPKGPVISTMSRAVESFRPSTLIKEIDEDVIDAAGMLSKRRVSVEETADDIIKNRDLVKVRRNVRGALSQQAKRGQYTEEDIAQAIFDRKLGEKLSATLGDQFGQLNESYKKFSDLSRFAYKNLRPKASEFVLTPGTRIIKKVATGKADKGELSAVRQLEQVTGIKFTGKASELGTKMDELKNLKPAKIQEIRTKFARREAELMRKKRQIVESNKRAKESVSGTKRSIDEKSAKVDKAINDIDQEIRANKEIVESMGLASGIAKNILYSGITSAVMGLTLNRVLRKN